MIDHLGISVSDFERSKRFYQAALAPLGYQLVKEYAGIAAGFGADGKPDFWIAPGTPTAGLHVAFTTRDRKTVDAFYEAAIAAGGRDNGKPGVRAQYHPNYYGAFVLDPDGYNVEAVCHEAVS
ncbi:MAG TPA: VOC family protein [Candidatus Binatia bacterium]